MIDSLLKRFKKNPQLRTVGQFLSSRQVVRLTRRNKPDGRRTREEFVLTVGALNHWERKYRVRQVGKQRIEYLIYHRNYPRAK